MKGHLALLALLVGCAPVPASDPPPDPLECVDAGTEEFESCDVSCAAADMACLGVYAHRWARAGYCGDLRLWRIGA